VEGIVVGSVDRTSRNSRRANECGKNEGSGRKKIGGWGSLGKIGAKTLETMEGV
jgi:hypothetical protein